LPEIPLPPAGLRYSLTWYGVKLIANDIDEVAFLSTRYSQSQQRTDALALTLVTSLGCNFACPYCFEDKHPSIMGTEVQDAIFALTQERLPFTTSIHITWFGGEPLIGKQAIFGLSDRILPLCDRRGVSYSADIVTNGYLLDAQICAELKGRRVSRMQISLDGPPDVHDRMRPLASGKSTFWKIVENLHVAVQHFSISIRINTDRGNVNRTEELLQILSREGFSGKLGVYLGKINQVNDGVASPSTTYLPGCFRHADFAQAELRFKEIAAGYGFSSPTLPQLRGAPCTAVRQNEYIVGSEGELYKCFDSVGNPNKVFGNVRDYKNANSRVNKWLSYTPFNNHECRDCIALPTCMGGCAHHAFDVNLYDSRCGTFRYTYQEQVLRYVEAFMAKNSPAAFARVRQGGEVIPEQLPILG
jgi:uncharacterized protein